LTKNDISPFFPVVFIYSKEIVVERCAHNA
jgi:hypothetical protein